MENIVLIGASEHAKVIIEIVEREGRYKIAGLLDRNRELGTRVLGYQVFGREEDLSRMAELHALRGTIVAIGDNFVRATVVGRILEISPDVRFVNAIHPMASIAREVSIGEGSVIMAGVSVNPSCIIGRFCILNTNSSLDHDSVMDDFASLAPGATVGGKCRIGSCSAVSIGAVLKHGIQVGEHTVIGAGSTVLRNQDSCRVVYGTPAREVRKRNPGDKYL